MSGPSTGGGYDRAFPSGPPELSGPGETVSTTPSVRAAGPSWMVWLQRVGENPDPARTGLDREQPAYAIGRCLLALPADGKPYSWCRRHGRAALLYGHLLNREELRQRLEVPPTPIPTDAALLLAAYESWGCDAASELEGVYAAVVWDEANDALMCVRDPTGMMPVFYARTSTGLVLASDLWTVLRHPGVSREINRLVVAEHMLYRLSCVEETFFRQVRRLPGAHRLLAHGTDVSVVRYWDPLPPPGQPIDWIGREELARFPELMQGTIRSYMALGPTAIALSAGIDSVSVAAFAVGIAEKCGWPRPHGLSLHFEDPSCDESERQTAVAAALEMPFRLFSFSECLGGRPLLEAVMELSASYPWPLDHVWGPLHTYLVQAAQSRGLRVMLTGIGGDEWLGVTPILAADLLQAGDLVGLWRLYQACLRSYDLSPTALARNLIWRSGLRQVLSDVGCRHFPGWMARRRQRLFVEPPAWLAPDPELRRQLCERLQPPAPEPPVEAAYLRELRRGMQHPLAALDLEQYYYRTRGNQVSYFHPFWSRPVAEFLLRTPPHLLNDGGRCKGFVRRMLAEQFPRLSFERQRKVNAVYFFSGLVAQQWPDIWRRWASDCALARAGLANAPGLDTAMKTADPFRDAGRIALWLSTEAWLQAQS